MDSNLKTEWQKVTVTLPAQICVAMAGPLRVLRQSRNGWITRLILRGLAQLAQDADSELRTMRAGSLRAVDGKTLHSRPTESRQNAPVCLTKSKKEPRPVSRQSKPAQKSPAPGAPRKPKRR
jgi:hypothetical protein